jgi:hypothetical protein
MGAFAAIAACSYPTRVFVDVGPDGAVLPTEDGAAPQGDGAVHEDGGASDAPVVPADGPHPHCVGGSW